MMATTPPLTPLSVVSTADPIGRVGSPKAFSQADNQVVPSMKLQMEQQMPKIAQQFSFALSSTFASSAFALPSAPALHRRTIQPFPSRVFQSAVGPLTASIQPAQATMSSVTTITQSHMQPTISQAPTTTPIPLGFYLQQHIDYGRLALALL